MSNEVKTWADGHGRWHAEVPATLWSAATRAANLIALEIWERSNKSEQPFFEVRHYVEEYMVSIPSEEPGRVHFAEYSI